MEKFTGEVKLEEENFKRIKKEIKNVLSFKENIKKNLSSDITVLLDVILGGAINLNASDIHIEPERTQTKLRVRIDGILHDVIFFEKKLHTHLLSRIKLLSKLKLNITDKPQNGRFSIATDDTLVEVRTSTLPSEYGEAIALRVLNPKNLIEIEGLGIREDMLDVFRKEIKKRSGMIVATGPTGCGKTTTLYAVLKKINSPEIKIITIEDPIEYHLEGISQTQVNPKKGYDFANGLKNIIRQDPDVILVGEIRDLKTAKISLQSALTGHLVLTTLHTNDSAGTIVRLQAFGEKPVNIAPAINISIGQRLVRKVCPKCSVLSKVSSEELNFLKKALGSLSKKIKMPKLNKNLKIAKAKGCKHCNFTGYKGRTGIFEFFLIDNEIENFILKKPSISELRKLAKKKGMIGMKKDGLIKVLKGETTLEEIERVTA
jgi:type II secretory ATPase GspE/PulE/Tfp pilus assembly ATPase PilB-like protein